MNDTSDILSISDIEQNDLFRVLYRHILKESGFEVSGFLKPAGIESLDRMRKLFKQITYNVGKINHITHDEWISMGILDFVPDDILNKLTYPLPDIREGFWADDVMHSKAMFFKDKRDKRNN